MSRWKELPASLDRRVWQLVVQMRALKDHSGLTQSALAAKTSYSGSSWARYLNGKAVPPRGAVEQLAQVCGADPGRLLALRDVAAEAWESEGAAVGAEVPADAEGSVDDRSVDDWGTREGDPVGGGGAGGSGGSAGPSSRRPGRRGPLLVGAVCALLLAVVAVLVVARPWSDGDASGEPRGPRPATVASNSRGEFHFTPGKEHRCETHRKDGDLYAGYSLTADALLDLNSTSWEVVEAQCLLKKRGYDPGTVDGAYGPRTKSAARSFQKSAGLAPDGIVGPDTWGALRR
ncbi:peptidoglycan-binding protein [Streptomyces sp. G45]|uniref:peptidoglycan-binding protein n=1 Tax=Streptomyces sp. G45 TaxID=3406627 RepID=UPI003C1B1776